MSELVRLDKAKQALAQVETVEEAKDIRDKAEAVRQYVKQAGLGLEAQNECADIKLRAERKGGELLGEMELSKGAATLSHDVTALPTLSELGIGRMQSSRWQLIASLPEETFEAYIAEVKSVSTGSVCRG